MCVVDELGAAVSAKLAHVGCALIKLLNCNSYLTVGMDRRRYLDLASRQRGVFFNLLLQRTRLYGVQILLYQ